MLRRLPGLCSGARSEHARIPSRTSSLTTTDSANRSPPCTTRCPTARTVLRCGFLLDTNVLSEFSRRADAHLAIQNWLTRANDFSLFTSILALAEIRRGVELLNSGKRRTQLEQWLNEELIPSFEDRVLPVTQAIADRWAVLSARLQRRGIPLATIDGLIVATALEHDLTVVTRNVKDFAAAGVSIINRWETGP